MTWPRGGGVPSPRNHLIHFMRTSTANKITLLNQTVLECLNETSEQKVIKSFTDAGLKVLGASFGFAWLKSRDEADFELIYKTANLPYAPMPPRRGGHNSEVVKTGLPYFVSALKKAPKLRYDVSPYMKSFVIIPMVYKEKTYGNIVLCFKKKKIFSREEKSLCAFIGNGAAQAVTLNRFYSNLENEVAKRTAQLQKANRQLEHDSAEDQAILSSIGEGLIVTDRNGGIILANPYAEQMLGWSKAQMLGQSIYSFLPLLDEHNESIEQSRRPLARALASGQKITTQDFSYSIKNGRVIPLAITASPVILDGQTVGAIEVFRDITEERKIDRAKSELISLASHQLRTPLAGINWYVEALVKEEVGKLNSTQKKYLEEVYNANLKLVEMVYDFLNVSRIELGTFNLKLSSVNLKEVSQGIIKELEPTVKAKKLKLAERYRGEIEQVPIDRKVIRITLQNLITNSVKYTPPRGRVYISIILEKPKGKPTLRVTVADTGVGIPKKDQDKIFSKLFRADNIKPLDANGTGLGLYIVKSFVQLCGGKIWFKSRENRGTTFYVDLPLEQKSPAAVPSSLI